MSAEVWHRPLWWCNDCAEGYDGDSDSAADVAADAAEHNRLSHEVLP